MTIEARKYDHLVGGLPGFTPRQIEQHIKLYEGYVKKINEIRAEIEKIPFAERKELSNFSFGKYSELKRREAVPYNGVYLHEMYFDNLGGKVREPKAELARAIESSFGSQSNMDGAYRAHPYVRRDRGRPYQNHANHAPIPSPATKPGPGPKTNSLISPTASAMESAANTRPLTSSRFDVSSICSLSPCRKRSRW